MQNALLNTFESYDVGGSTDMNLCKPTISPFINMD